MCTCKIITNIIIGQVESEGKQCRAYFVPVTTLVVVGKLRVQAPKAYTVPLVAYVSDAGHTVENALE